MIIVYTFVRRPSHRLFVVGYLKSAWILPPPHHIIFTDIFDSPSSPHPGEPDNLYMSQNRDAYSLNSTEDSNRTNYLYAFLTINKMARIASDIVSEPCG